MKKIFKFSTYIILFFGILLMAGCKPTTPDNTPEQEPNKYTITYNTNGGNEIDPVTLEEGSLIVLPTPTKEGYTFINWCYDEELKIEVDKEMTLTDNLTIYASWQKNIEYYGVTYQLDGGLNNELNPTTISSESKNIQ